MKRYDRISTYFKMNLSVVIPMCITALLFNALMCVLPILEGQTINSLKSGDYALVVRFSAAFIALVVFVQLNRFCKRYLVRVFGNKMTLCMREVSLTNLLRRDISFFAEHNTGDILNKNLSDIYDTTEGIRKMTTECFDTFVLLLGYSVTMLLMDWQITLVAFVFIASSIIVSHFMKRFVYRANKDYKEYLSLNKQITLTCLNNELYYRGFGVSERYYRDYEQSSKVLQKKNTKALVFQSSLEPLYSSVALTGLFFIIYMGGTKVINGVYEIGVFSAFLTTYMLVAKKAARVGKVFNAYQGFKVSWQRCRGLLTAQEEATSEITPSAEGLVLKEFSYGYAGGFSLPKITFSAVQGEIVGICGRVHTGKSTLLKALTGLYSYGGEASLGGIPLADCVQSPKQYIGYCGAEVALFSDTIKNNIALGRSGDCERAVYASGLESDLKQMGGFDGKLSHSNANISGGQQKRLQMARTLYGDTRLVLLDDPFQSVNPELAEEIIQRLTEYPDRIILLASNNPAVLRQTAKIIYFGEETVHVDSYENLMKITEFQKLMGVCL